LAGRKVDIGLIAEALVFYDKVYVGITSDEQYSKVVAWFQSQGLTNELIALIKDGVFTFYYYAFVTLPGQKDQIWSIMNLQVEAQAKEAVFAERVINSGLIDGLVKKKSLRDALDVAVLDNHVEVKAEEFGASLESARVDYMDPDRAAALMQLVYDDLYRELGMIKPPVIEAKAEVPGPGLNRITWNRDFSEFKNKLGPAIDVHGGTALAAAGFGVKTIWSAATLASDLYVGSPLIGYATYKLDEGSRVTKAKAIVEELVAEVSFPDIRDLVNRGRIGARDVLGLRGKAGKFRQWLRDESSVERDALAAYLGQLADEAGWKKELGKIIRVSGAVAGAVVGAAAAGPWGAAAGALAGEGLKFITDIAGRLDEGWKPKVFGQQAAKQIAKAIKKK
jgi:hypothetical protein